MLEEISVRVCDICGKSEVEEEVCHHKLCDGFGHQPTADDPLAQEFKKVYHYTDLCWDCYEQFSDMAYGLSHADRQEICMLTCIRQK